jgi:hypothetical protein
MALKESAAAKAVQSTAVSSPFNVSLVKVTFVKDVSLAWRHCIIVVGSIVAGVVGDAGAMA